MSVQKLALRIIYSFSNDIPYTVTLKMSQILPTYPINQSNTNSSLLNTDRRSVLQTVEEIEETNSLVKFFTQLTLPPLPTPSPSRSCFTCSSSSSGGSNFEPPPNAPPPRIPTRSKNISRSYHMPFPVIKHILPHLMYTVTLHPQ